MCEMNPEIMCEINPDPYNTSLSKGEVSEPMYNMSE
jgi:hypothetical protein